MCVKMQLILSCFEGMVSEGRYARLRSDMHQGAKRGEEKILLLHLIMSHA